MAKAAWLCDTDSSRRGEKKLGLKHFHSRLELYSKHLSLLSVDVGVVALEMAWHVHGTAIVHHF